MSERRRDAGRSPSGRRLPARRGGFRDARGDAAADHELGDAAAVEQALERQQSKSARRRLPTPTCTRRGRPQPERKEELSIPSSTRGGEHHRAREEESAAEHGGEVAVDEREEVALDDKQMESAHDDESGSTVQMLA